MKVILLKDIAKLGKKHELKEVKNGYARNFLLPQKLAKIATRGNLEWLKKQKESERQKAEEHLKKLQRVVAQIDGQEIIMPVKLGSKGELFEKITSQKITESLKERGFQVSKRQLELTEPLKELGEFPVKINFEHGLEAEIRVIVTEEKEGE